MARVIVATANKQSADTARRVRRKHAALTVKTITGKRHTFHDLRPHTALVIERHVLGDPVG